MALGGFTNMLLQLGFTVLHVMKWPNAANGPYVVALQCHHGHVHVALVCHEIGPHHLGMGGKNINCIHIAWNLSTLQKQTVTWNHSTFTSLETIQLAASLRRKGTLWLHFGRARPLMTKKAPAHFWCVSPVLHRRGRRCQSPVPLMQLEASTQDGQPPNLRNWPVSKNLSMTTARLAANAKHRPGSKLQINRQDSRPANACRRFDQAWFPSFSKSESCYAQVSSCSSCPRAIVLKLSVSLLVVFW